MQDSWVRLIEAPLCDVHQMARDLALPLQVRLYSQILSAYLQGDTAKLETLGVDLPQPLDLLWRLRKTIALGPVDSRELIRISEIDLDGEIFTAEKNFCLALGWERSGNDLQALNCFMRAADLYRLAGCPRKALRAHYNSVAADSRLNPHKNFVAEYQSVIELSRRQGDREFAGMALAMLSREYQIMGLFEKALAMSEESVEALESERGCLHYYHSLLHRAHVLIEVGRPEEAQLLLREAEMAPFAPITAARRLLLHSLDPTSIWDRKWEADLLPTWKNRLPQLLSNTLATGSGPGVSPMEEQLLKLAYNGPVEKWDLIRKLYPDQVSLLIAENRFKNLLARVRKKYPGLLSCSDGRYSLARLPEGMTK